MASPRADLLETLFSGIAAVGAIAAFLIAVRALTVSRRSVAVDQLFAAFADLIASVQAVANAGVMRGSEDDSGAQRQLRFQRFAAARARVDLALTALGVSGPYSRSLLDLTNNFAAGVLQADELGDFSRDKLPENLLDRSWVANLTWKPSDAEVEILARSVSFTEVRYSMELVDEDEIDLKKLDKWWADIVLRWEMHHPGSSNQTSDLAQTSRLLDDFTRDYLQPMAEQALQKFVSGRSKSPLRYAKRR